MENPVVQTSEPGINLPVKGEITSYNYYKMHLLGGDPDKAAYLKNENNKFETITNFRFPEKEEAFSQYMADSNIPKEKKSEEHFNATYTDAYNSYNTYLNTALKYEPKDFRPVPSSPVTNEYAKLSGYQSIFESPSLADFGKIPAPNPVYDKVLGTDRIDRKIADDSMVAFQKGFYYEKNPDGEVVKKDLTKFKDEFTPFDFLLTALANAAGPAASMERMIDLSKKRKLVLGNDVDGSAVFSAMGIDDYAIQSKIYEDFNDQRKLENPFYTEFFGGIYNSFWNSIPSGMATIAEMSDYAFDLLSGNKKEAKYGYNSIAQIYKTYAATEQYRRGLIDEEKGLVSWNGLPYMLGTVAGSLAQYYTGSKAFSALGMSPKAAFQSSSWALGSLAADSVRQYGEENDIPRGQLIPFMAGAWALQSIIENTGQNYLFEKWLLNKSEAAMIKSSLKESLVDAGVNKTTLSNGNASFLAGAKWMQEFIKKKTNKDVDLVSFVNRTSALPERLKNIYGATIEETREEVLQQGSVNMMQILHDTFYYNSPQFYDDSSNRDGFWGGLKEFKTKTYEHIGDDLRESAFGGFLGGFFGGAIMPKKQKLSNYINYAVITNQQDKVLALINETETSMGWSPDANLNKRYAEALRQELSYKSRAYKDAGIKKYYEELFVNPKKVLKKDSVDHAFAEYMAMVEKSDSNSKPYLMAWLNAAHDLNNHKQLNPEEYQNSGGIKGKEAWMVDLKEKEDLFNRLSTDEYKLANYTKYGFDFYSIHFSKDYGHDPGSSYKMFKELAKDLPQSIIDVNKQLYEQMQKKMAEIDDMLLGVPDNDGNRSGGALNYFKEVLKDGRFTNPLDIISALNMFQNIRTFGSTDQIAVDEFSDLFNKAMDNYISDLRKKYGVNDMVSDDDLLNDLLTEQGPVEYYDHPEFGPIKSKTTVKNEDGAETLASKLTGQWDMAEGLVAYTIKDAKREKEFTNRKAGTDTAFTSTVQENLSPEEVHDILYSQAFDSTTGKYSDFETTVANLINAAKEGLAGGGDLNLLKNYLILLKRLAFFSSKFHNVFIEDVNRSAGLYETKPPVKKDDPYYNVYEGDSKEFIENLNKLISEIENAERLYAGALSDSTTKYNIDLMISNAALQAEAINELVEKLTRNSSWQDEKKKVYDKSMVDVAAISKEVNEDLKKIKENWEKQENEMDALKLGELKELIDKLRLKIYNANSLLHDVLQFYDVADLNKIFTNAAITSTLRLMNYSNNVDAENKLKEHFNLFNQVSGEIGSTVSTPILSAYNILSTTNGRPYVKSMFFHMNNLWRYDPAEYYQIHKLIDDKYKASGNEFYMDDPEQELVLFHAMAFFNKSDNVGRLHDGSSEITDKNFIDKSTAYKNILSIAGRAGVGKTFLVERLSAMILEKIKQSSKSDAKRIIVVGPSAENIKALSDSVKKAMALTGSNTTEVLALTHDEFLSKLKAGEKFESSAVFIDEITRVVDPKFNGLVQSNVSGVVYEIGDFFQHNTPAIKGNMVSYYPVAHFQTEKTVNMLSSKRISNPSVDYFNIMWIKAISINRLLPFGKLSYNKSRTEGVYAEKASVESKAKQIDRFVADLKAGKKTVAFVTDTKAERKKVIDEVNNLLQSDNSISANEVEALVYQLEDYKHALAQGLEFPEVYIRFEADEFKSNSAQTKQFKLAYTAISRSISFIDIIMPVNSDFTSNEIPDDNNDVAVYKEKLAERNKLNNISQVLWITRIESLLRNLKGSKVENTVSVKVEQSPIGSSVSSAKKEAVVKNPPDSKFQDAVLDNEKRLTAYLGEAEVTSLGILPADHDYNSIEGNTDANQSIYLVRGNNGNIIIFRNINEHPYGRYIKFLDNKWLASKGNYEYLEGRHNDIVKAFGDLLPRLSEDDLEGLLSTKLFITPSGEYRIGYFLNRSSNLFNIIFSAINNGYYKDIQSVPDSHLIVGYEYLPDVFRMENGVNLFRSWNNIVELARASNYDVESFLNKIPALVHNNNPISYVDYIKLLHPQADKVLDYEKEKIRTWFKHLQMLDSGVAPINNVDLTSQTTAPTVVFEKDHLYKGFGDFIKDNFLLDDKGNPVVFIDSNGNKFYKHKELGYYVGMPVFLNEKINAADNVYKAPDTMFGRDKNDFEIGWYVPIKWNVLGGKSTFVKIKTERFTPGLKSDGSDYYAFKSWLLDLIDNFEIDPANTHSYIDQLNELILEPLLSYTQHFWIDRVSGSLKPRPEWNDSSGKSFIEIREGEKTYVRFRKSNPKETPAESYSRLKEFLNKVAKYGTKQPPQMKIALYGLNTIMHIVGNNLNAFKILFKKEYNIKVDFEGFNNLMIHATGSDYASLNMFYTNIKDVLTNSFLVLNDDKSEPVKPDESDPGTGTTPPDEPSLPYNFKIKNDEVFSPEEYDAVKNWLASVSPFMNVNGVIDLQSPNSAIPLWGMLTNAAAKFMGARFGLPSVTLSLDATGRLAEGGYFVAGHELGHKFFNALKPEIQNRLIAQIPGFLAAENKTSEETMSALNSSERIELLMDYISNNVLLDKNGMPKIKKKSTGIQKLFDIVSSFIDQILNLLGLSRRYTAIQQFLDDVENNRFAYDLISYSRDDNDFKQKVTPYRSLVRIFGNPSGVSEAKTIFEWFTYEISIFNSKNRSAKSLKDSIGQLYANLKYLSNKIADRQIEFSYISNQKVQTVSKNLSDITPSDFTQFVNDYLNVELSKTDRGKAGDNIRNYLMYKLGSSKQLFIAMAEMAFPDQNIKKILKEENQYKPEIYDLTSKKFESIDDDAESSEQEIGTGDARIDSEFGSFSVSQSTFLDLMLKFIPVFQSRVIKSVSSYNNVETIYNYDFEVSDNRMPPSNIMEVTDYLHAAVKNHPLYLRYGNEAVEDALIDILKTANVPLNDQLNNTLRAIYMRMFHVPKLVPIIVNKPVNKDASLESNPELANEVYEALGFGQENDIEAKKADIEIGKVGNTEYEVKVDGVYYQGKKLNNPENKTHRQLIEDNIERRRQEDLLGKSFTTTTEKVVTGKGQSSGKTIVRYTESKVSSDGEVLTIKPKAKFKNEDTPLSTTPETITVKEFKQQFYENLSEQDKEMFDEFFTDDSTRIKLVEARIGLKGSAKGQVNIDIQSLDGQPFGFELQNGKEINAKYDAELKALEAQITPQQKQQAQQLYSQYLDSLNKTASSQSFTYEKDNIVSKYGLSYRAVLANKEAARNYYSTYETTREINGKQIVFTEESKSDYVAKIETDVLMIYNAFYNYLHNFQSQQLANVEYDKDGFAHLRKSYNPEALPAYEKIRNSLRLIGSVQEVEVKNEDGSESIKAVYAIRRKFLNKFHNTGSFNIIQLNGKTYDIIQKIKKETGIDYSSLYDVTKTEAIQSILSVPEFAAHLKSKLKIATITDSDTSWFDALYAFKPVNYSLFNYNADESVLSMRIGDKYTPVLKIENGQAKFVVSDIPHDQQFSFKLNVARQVLDALGLERQVVGNNVISNILINSYAENKNGLAELKRVMGNDSLESAFGEDRMANFLIRSVRSIVAPKKEDFVSFLYYHEIEAPYIGVDEEAADVHKSAYFSGTDRTVNTTKDELFVTLDEVDNLDSKNGIAHPMAHRSDISDLASIVTFNLPKGKRRFVLNSKGNREYVVAVKAITDKLPAVINKFKEISGLNPESFLRFNPLVNGDVELKNINRLFLLKAAKIKSADKMTINDLASVYMNVFIGAVYKNEKMIAMPLFIPGKNPRIHIATLENKNDYLKNRSLLSTTTVTVETKNGIHKTKSTKLNPGAILNSFNEVHDQIFQAHKERVKVLHAALKKALPKFDSVHKNNFNIAIQSFQSTGNVSYIDNFLLSILNEKSNQVTDLERQAIVNNIINYAEQGEKIGDRVFMVNDMLQEYSDYILQPVYDSSGNKRYDRILAGNKISMQHRFIENNNVVSMFMPFNHSNYIELKQFTESIDEEYKLAELTDDERNNLIFFHLKNEILNIEKVKEVEKKVGDKTEVFSKKYELNWFQMQVARLNDIGLKYNPQAKKSTSYGNDDFTGKPIQNNYWSEGVYVRVVPAEMAGHIKGKLLKRMKLVEIRGKKYFINNFDESLSLPAFKKLFTSGKDYFIRGKKISPYYEALIWQTLFTTFHSYQLFGHDPVNSKNPEFGLSRNRFASLAGATPNVGLFGMPSRMLVATFNEGQYLSLNKATDGMDMMTDVAAAMMYLSGFGGDYSSVVNNYTGSFKMGAMIKEANGNDIQLKSMSSILSVDDTKDNPDLELFIKKAYSLMPLVDETGAQKTVWDIYVNNNKNPIKTAIELIRLKQFNPDIYKSFISIIAHPSTVKTFKLTPNYNLYSTDPKQPLYVSDIPTEDYRHLAKLFNKLVTESSNSNQRLNAMMFGNQNITSVGQQLNQITNDYIAKEVARFESQIAKKGADSVIRKIVSEAMRHRDGGNVLDYVTNSKLSLSLSNASKYIVPILKAKYQGIYNPFSLGMSAVQTSTAYVAYYTNKNTGQRYTHSQLLKMKTIIPSINLADFEKSYGSRFINWVDANGKVVIGDNEILHVDPKVLSDMAINQNLRFKPAELSWAFDFWDKMGYSDDPNSPWYWRNFDVPEITLIIKSDGSYIHYDQLGYTEADRYNALQNIDINDLHNSHAGRMILNLYIDEIESAITKAKIERGEENPFTTEEEDALYSELFYEKYYEWSELFNRQRYRSLTRTPHQLSSMAGIFKIDRFTNNSANKAGISAVYAYLANADQDGDLLSGFAYKENPEGSEDEYFNSRMNLDLEYYSNPKNMEIYYSPVTTDISKQSVDNLIAEFKTLGSKDLKGVYDFISQLQAFENAHYADDLIGMVANVLKAYSMMYWYSNNKATPGPDFNWKLIDGINPDGSIKYSEETYTSFSGYSGDMLDDKGNNILFAIADYMQAIIDHEKTLLVHKLLMNPHTLNAQMSMLIAGVNRDKVFSIFKKAEDILNVFAKNENLDSLSYYESPVFQLEKAKVFLDAIEKQFLEIDTLAKNPSTDSVNLLLNKWNSDIGKFNYHIGLDLPFIGSYEASKNDIPGIGKLFNHYDYALTVKKLQDYKLSIIQLLDIYKHAEGLNDLTGIIKVTTNGTGPAYEEYKFFENNMAIIESPYLIAGRIKSEEKKVLSLAGYIPEVKNQISPTESISVLYAPNPRVVFNETRKVATSFFDVNNLLNSNHYLGYNGIIGSMKDSYLKVVGTTILSRNRHFIDAIKTALSKIGMKSMPNNKAYWKTIDAYEQMAISEWLQGHPLTGLDWSYESLRAGIPINSNHLESKVDRLQFMIDTISFFERLLHNPESLGFSDTQLAFVRSNTFLQAIEVYTDDYDTKHIRLKESINSNDQNVLSRIQTGLYLLNRLIAKKTDKNNSLINMLWLYQLMSDRLNIYQYSLTRALPIAEGIMPLESLSKHVEAQLRILNTAPSNIVNDEINKISNGVLNGLVHNHKLIPSTPYMKASDIPSIKSAYLHATKNSKYVYAAELIRGFDEEAFIKSKNNALESWKYDLDWFVPINKEAITKNFGETKAAEIFKYKEDISIQNIPNYIKVKIRKSVWFMQYNPESMRYERVWVTYSNINPSYNSNLNPLVNIPTIKPDLERLLEFEKNGIVTIDLKDGKNNYKVGQQVMVDGAYGYIHESKPRSITVSKSQSLPDTKPLTSKLSNVNKLINDIVSEYNSIASTVKNASGKEGLDEFAFNVRTHFGGDRFEPIKALVSRIVYNELMERPSSTEEEIKANIIYQITCRI